MICLPAGCGGSSSSRFSASRYVAHGAMPSALRISSSRRHPNLARVERSRRAERAVRRSGETRRRAHLFFIVSLAACGSSAPVPLWAAGGLRDNSSRSRTRRQHLIFFRETRGADGLAPRLRRALCPLLTASTGVRSPRRRNGGGTGRQQSARALVLKDSQE